MKLSKFGKGLIILGLICLLIGCSSKKVGQVPNTILIVDKADSIVVGENYKEIIIKSPGVELYHGQAEEITIEESVGDGEVVLSDIRTNKLHIRGGGTDSIYIRDSSILNEIEFKREEGPVRINSDESSTMKTIIIAEESNDVIIEGDAEEVFIDGKDINIIIKTGTIKTIFVNAKSNLWISGKVDAVQFTKESEGSKVSIGEFGEIGLIRTETYISISGKGSIKKIITNNKDNIQGDFLVEEIELEGDSDLNDKRNPAKGTEEGPKAIQVKQPLLPEDSSVEDKNPEEAKENPKEEEKEDKKTDPEEDKEDKEDKEDDKTPEEKSPPPQSSKTYYKVRFLGLEGEEITSKMVEKGKPATAPQVRVIEGYSFIGWDKDFSSVSQDMTVQGLYEKNSYLVSFDSNNGSMVESIEVEYGELISKPEDPSFEGSKFVGWFLDSRFSQLWDFTKDLVKKATTLFAKWERIKSSDSSLKSVKVDGIPAIKDDSDSLSYNVELSKGTDLKELTKDNFEIEANHSNAQVEVSKSEDDNKKWLVNLKAEDGTSEVYEICIKVSETHYKVIFDLDGGNIGGSNENIVLLVEAGKNVEKLPERPTMAFNVFGAWKEQNNKVFDTTIKVEKDMVVFANWEEKRFSINGGNVSLTSNGVIKDYPNLSWEDSTNTLTMNGYEGGYLSFKYTFMDSITINVTGVNTITEDVSSALSFNKDLNIIGEGTLNLTSKGHYGIEAVGGLQIEDTKVNIDYEKTVGLSNPAAAINGNVVVRGEGAININVKRNLSNNHNFKGINGKLNLHNSASANIQLIDNVNINNVIGVDYLELNGTGECEISIESKSKILIKAVEKGPVITPSNYTIEGSWASKQVKYYTED